MIKQSIALLLVSGSALAQTYNSTCAKQCLTDADCVGCGPSGKGKCSIPYPGNDTQAKILLPLTATCVEVPTTPPPTEPKPEAGYRAAVTPMQHHGELTTIVYPDFSDTVKYGFGDVTSDAYFGALRHDWTDYLGQGKQTQMWMPNGQYYITLKSGLCIHFVMRDDDKSAVGIPTPNWLQECANLTNNLVYVGRETVNGEWADHWACYAVVGHHENNVTIAFQNWHALGLGPNPLGTPLKVTGSNSHPAKIPPSSRLTTMIYSNFTSGNKSVPEGIFDLPKVCLPVSAELSARDLTRAKQKVPRSHLAGTSVSEAMMKLNANLKADTELHTAPCETLPLEQLQELQLTIFAARHEKLQQVYEGDNRKLPYDSTESLVNAHRQQAATSASRPDLRAMIRDGVCQETVMMYIHHLSAPVRDSLKALPTFVLPLLPERELHAKPAQDELATQAHGAYVAQATCAVCHVAP